MMRSRPLVACLALAALAASLPGAGPLGAQTAASAGELPAVDLGSPADPAAAAARLFGRSGKLQAAVMGGREALDRSLFAALAGDSGVRYRWVPVFRPASGGVLGEPVAAPAEPGSAGALEVPAEHGVWRLEAEGADGTPAAAPPFSLITRVPFAQKKGGYLNGYHIGQYPVEGSARADRYAVPAGFIEVTPESQDLAVSEHFRLRQFLTKDQHSVWPKYLALDLRLIDKLELVMQELNAMGVRAEHMHVMSGFRTPQYNGPGEGGRARLSRHMYGDAADVWVDSDRDGFIDDLNGDGRRDLYDAQLILRAVDRVEARHPELVGGAGVYNESPAHGPFVHIDVRGTRSRW